MEEKLLLFINQLRKAGVKVSLVETLDLFNALNLVPWDKETFYNTLLTSLIKEHEYYPLFDKLFNYYFSQEAFFHQKAKLALSYPLRKKSKENVKATCNGQGHQGLSGGGGQGQGKASIPLSSFVHTLRFGTDKELENLIDLGVTSLGEISERHLFERDEVIRHIKVFLQWKMGQYELEKTLAKASELEKLEVEQKLLKIEDLLQDKLDRILLLKYKDKAMEEILRRTNINELDFFELAKNQVEEIKKKLTRLAHKLSTRNSLREIKTKKGNIKIQATIRKAMATGGVPIYPIFSGKRPSRPEFIILCDLSGSVRLFSEFMLQLVYSIQSRYLHVRSFAFVDTIHEITNYFKGKEIEEGIKEIYYHGKFSKTGFSHYGESFKAFNSQYLQLVSRKTTFLILGDARNNYQNPFHEELMKIKETAYKVIWLNPAPKENWNKDDSIIRLYKPYCHQIYECRNLKQLEEVTNRIF